ncbi:MAG: TonB-dependent receptor [Bacteroidales bacterium]|nr:TonB-dependent receptor [Bacteroidales bacterium]
MKRLVLLIFAFFAVLECLPQRITGIVTDDTGLPLYGANVIVGGSRQSGTTDANGNFSVRCRKGEQRIVVSYSGFDRYDEKHFVGDNGIYLDTIKLKITYVSDDSLHILEAISDRRTPMTFATYDETYINRRNISRDIPSILEHTPSFVALSENGSGIGFTDYRIRGIGHEAINITLNGIQLTDPDSRKVLWHHLPDFASSTSSISITRGIGSSSSGTYAYGASIDIKTNPPSDKPYGDISVMGGAFGTTKASISAGTGIMKNGFSIDLRMAKLISNGYIEMSGSNQNAIMVSATWRGKTNSLSANIIYGKTKTGISRWGCPAQYIETNREYNSAGEYFDRNSSRKYYEDTKENYQQTHVQLIYSQKIWNSIELNLKGFFNRGDGYDEEYKNQQYYINYGLQNLSLPTVVSHEGQSFTSITTISQTDLIRRLMESNNFYGGTISATHEIGKFVNTFGLTGKFYEGKYFGNIIWMQYAGNTEKDHKWYSNSSDKDEFSAFYKVGCTFIDKITLYADVQYRMIDYEMTGIDRIVGENGSQNTISKEFDYNFFNPKGGINYEITPKMRLYASVAHSHREPSRESIRETAQSSESIDSESLVDYELGYSYKSKVFSGELNLYYMDYRDQIVPTGEFSQYGYYIMTNVDKSYRAGIELTAAVKPHRRLQIEANATFSKNRIKDYYYTAQTYDGSSDGTIDLHISNAKIAYSPEIIASGSINYNIFGNFNLFYNVKYVGKQHYDNTSSNDRIIKPYCISSLGFDYEIITKYVKGIRFKFEVNNLFNTKYNDNAYGGLWYELGNEKSWANYFPQSGIYFMGGATISF